MIVSHRHRFIFVHLQRTGGRSLTSRLAKHCGPEDIITPVRDDRYPIPGQNCEGINRHATAARIRAHVGEEVWKDYFKFTFERNPWDKIVSRYIASAMRSRRLFEAITGDKASFRTYFALRVLKGYTFGLGNVRLPRHYHYYTENGRLAVDFIGRIENRAAHVAELCKRIGLPDEEDIRIESIDKKVRAPYTETIRPWMRPVIERAFAKDLALLKYEFGAPNPTDYIERAPDGSALYREPVAEPFVAV